MGPEEKQAGKHKTDTTRRKEQRGASRGFSSRTHLVVSLRNGGELLDEELGGALERVHAGQQQRRVFLRPSHSVRTSAASIGRKQTVLVAQQSTTTAKRCVWTGRTHQTHSHQHVDLKARQPYVFVLGVDVCAARDEHPDDRLHLGRARLAARQHQRREFLRTDAMSAHRFALSLASTLFHRRLCLCLLLARWPSGNIPWNMRKTYINIAHRPIEKGERPDSGLGLKTDLEAGHVREAGSVDEHLGGLSAAVGHRYMQRRARLEPRNAKHVSTCVGGRQGDENKGRRTRVLVPVSGWSSVVVFRFRSQPAATSALAAL
eukprot:2328479-Rhodomonas_salina.3